MNDHEIEVYRQFQTEQGKFLYVILAFISSAILYSLKLLDNRTLEWRLLPIGLAVVCWLISLYQGVRFLQYRNAALRNNLELLQTKNELAQNQQINQTKQLEKINAIYSAIESQSNICSNYGIWQMRFVFMGVFLFVLWFMLEMILRTYKI